MMQLSGGQAAVKALQTERSEVIFGLIGSATMEMFDALYSADDMRFIGVHDERTGSIWPMDTPGQQGRRG